MVNLPQHSIQVILTHQAPSGAYPASPTFPTYRYSWFRDGAFIAYAMDVVGEHESARRFHDWVVRTLLRHREQAERAIRRAERGRPLDEDYLHTRYTLDGEIGDEEWPNFQLDGLGTWLWALAAHVRRRGDNPYTLPPPWREAVKLTARYLAALWAYPCYDLWEEHPQYLHPYTLSAIYAGLWAAGELLATADRRRPTADSPSLSDVADRVRDFALTHGVQDGHLVKSIVPPEGTPALGSSSSAVVGEASPTVGGPPSAAVDASLIGVSTPHRLLSPTDPLMQATVARIETDLHCEGGGVHRYRADTYYGGGEWVLLAGWLGWYYVEAGEPEQARALLRWIEAQADPEGNLPEQVSTHLLAPAYYSEWEALWGPVAKPLLWSHAMYLILHRALEGVSERA